MRGSLFEQFFRYDLFSTQHTLFPKDSCLATCSYLLGLFYKLPKMNKQQRANAKMNVSEARNSRSISIPPSF